MPRNSSGTMSLPSGNPVVSGTTVDPDWANTTLGDLATELSDSLSRSGKGGMTAPMRTPDGAVGAPAHSFTSDTDTGLFSKGAGNPAMAVNGTERQEWTTSGSNIAGALGVSGAASVGGALDVTGATTVNGVVGLAKTDMPAIGQVISASSFAFSGSSTSIADVTNLQVTLTTTGRPVLLMLVSDGGSAGSIAVTNAGPATSAVGNFYVVRDTATTIAMTMFNVSGASASSIGYYVTPPVWFDAPAAGAHTYKVRYSVTAGSSLAVNNMKLVAFEL